MTPDRSTTAVAPEAATEPRVRVAGHNGDHAVPLPKKKGLLQRPAMILALALVAGVGSYFGLHALFHSLTHETTDDAFTEGHIIAIAPRVAGQIRAVHVVENQQVHKGDLLVEIDPQDYQITQKQRDASLANAKTSKETARAGLLVVEARMETAKASREQARAESESAAVTATRAQADFQRAEELRQRKVTSPQEYDLARAAAETSERDLQAAKKKLAATESQVAEAQAQVDAARTYVDAADVKIHQAELDLQQAGLEVSYTTIVAPEDGRIARKSAEPGAYVQVGQNLLALVPRRVWTVANFKETQLAEMKQGQPTELTISAYPDRTYRGHVESFHAGGGARFSLLPPENATGNFVKVVQRVPVKIEFDESLDDLAVIGPGLSVEPDVAIRAAIPGIFAIAGAALVGVLLFIFLTLRARKKAAQD